MSTTPPIRMSTASAGATRASGISGARMRRSSRHATPACSSGSTPRPEALPWSAVLEVVIVSYRCGPMLRECLQTLHEHPPTRGLRITVVDNDSGDGTADVVRREFQDVRLVALDENVG